MLALARHRRGGAGGGWRCRPRRTTFVTDPGGFLSEPAAAGAGATAGGARAGHRAAGGGLDRHAGTGEAAEALAIEEWAARSFEAWRVGRQGKDDGVALFVLPAERKMRIEVGLRPGAVADRRAVGAADPRADGAPAAAGRPRRRRAGGGRGHAGGGGAGGRGTTAAAAGGGTRRAARLGRACCCWRSFAAVRARRRPAPTRRRRRDCCTRWGRGDRGAGSAVACSGGGGLRRRWRLRRRVLGWRLLGRRRPLGRRRGDGVVVRPGARAGRP